jgi:hypothetical protein
LFGRFGAVLLIGFKKLGINAAPRRADSQRLALRGTTSRGRFKTYEALESIWVKRSVEIWHSGQSHKAKDHLQASRISLHETQSPILRVQIVMFWIGSIRQKRDDEADKYNARNGLHKVDAKARV